MENRTSGGNRTGRAPAAAPIAGTTRPWPGDPPRGVPPAGSDPRRAPFAPRLDRTSRVHAAWHPPRVLEPESMGACGEAEAYMDAAAQAHLARLDAAWVEAVLAAGPRGPARVLDVGTGGGQIPAHLARRRPDWRIWGVDRAGTMLRAGQGERAAAARRAARAARTFHLAVARADGRRLPAADGAFDLVISNSLLHHLGDPTPVLDEIARVAGPDGRVLLRDLRRPSRLAFRAHVAWHGRRYAGAMRRLYEASVAAAFTPAELATILRHSGLAGARVGAAGPYLVVERERLRAGGVA